MARLFGDAFEGLKAEHFDAFLEHKWRSHRFNLERMRAAEVLDIITVALGELKGLSIRRSTAHPEMLNGNRVDALWLYTQRPDKDQETVTRAQEKEKSLAHMVGSPDLLRRFAFAGLRLDEHSLAWGFFLHQDAVLDVRNFNACLKDSLERSRLSPLLRALPAGDGIYVNSQTQGPMDCLSAWQNGLPEFSGYLHIGGSYNRQECYDLGQEIITQIKTRLPAYFDLFSFLAWTFSTDRLDLSTKLRAQKKVQAKKLSGLEQGDKVKITRGLLSGQEGLIQEISQKGQARVLIGRVAVEMPLDMLSKL